MLTTVITRLKTSQLISVFCFIRHNSVNATTKDERHYLFTFFINIKY